MNNMNEQKKKIEELKEILNELINIKGDLLDNEVIEISKLLDEHLVEYHKLLEDKKQKQAGL